MVTSGSRKVAAFVAIAFVTLACASAGCRRDEPAPPTPSVSATVDPSGAESTSDAETGVKPSEEEAAGPDRRERPGKQFSMYSDNLTVGEPKTVEGSSIELVSITNSVATFRVDGKESVAKSGECFEAGEHKCDVHKTGTTTWCVSRLWDNGAVVAPKGHH